MYDISYHLCNIPSLFLQYFKGEHLPKEDLIRKWLIAYNEESNRLDNVVMTKEEFDRQIENDLKKVIVNMLLIRLQLITRALFFELDTTRENKPPTIKDYCMSIYRDFVKHKDEHLKLLETIEE